MLKERGAFSAIRKVRLESLEKGYSQRSWGLRMIAAGGCARQSFLPGLGRRANPDSPTPGRPFTEKIGSSCFCGIAIHTHPKSLFHLLIGVNIGVFGHRNDE